MIRKLILLPLVFAAFMLMSPVNYEPAENTSVSKLEKRTFTVQKSAKRVSFKSPNNNWGCRQCPGLFDDNVQRHNRAYGYDAINPKESFEDVEAFYEAGILEKIDSNSFYTLDKMNYSAPYLLPAAAEFLHDLGMRYAEKCAAEGVKYYPFEITSITRCTGSVKKLRRGNRNAIENSAHLRGKTVDISYRKFYSQTKQLNLFVDALYELKSEGRCFVKYERTGCLHITAR